MLSFKVTGGGSVSGVILAEEAMVCVRVRKGDILYLAEAPGGGYRLTHHNPEFARQRALSEETMHDDRDVLPRLAK